MLKVISKNKPDKKTPIEIGQFYGRYDDPESIYLITSTYINGHTYYSAIMLNHGVSYIYPVKDIDKVFDRFDDKFYLIKDLTITING